MRWCPPVVLATALLALVGCSQGATPKASSPSAARAAPLTTRPAVSPAPPPGSVGLSPAGVTTRVDVPADSTEEEYFQACHAAKLWMATQPRTGESLLEPYLAMVQTSPSPTAGTWNNRWADLTPARQAAVITAARAAANEECG